MTDTNRQAECSGASSLLSGGYREVTEAAAQALTLEKRQEFLDHVWSGKKLGDAYKAAGISFDAAIGVMNMNIKETKHLRRESL